MMVSQKGRAPGGRALLEYKQEVVTMKIRNFTNTIAAAVGFAAATLLTVVALVAMVMADAAIAMDWLPLAGLVLAGGVVGGLISWFFKSIEER